MPNIIPFARTSEENWVVCILDRKNNLFYFIFLVTALCIEVETCRPSRLADFGTHSTSAWCEAAKRGLDGKNWFELSCLSVHWKWRTKKKYFYGKGRLQRETLAELYPLVSCAPTCITPPGGGVLPYMGYIGMCRCEGYGFQAVYFRTGYINQNVWV